MAKRVLVTGCSSPLGAAFVGALATHPLVRRIVGIDVRPPDQGKGPDSKFTYYPADVRDSVYLRSLIEEEEIDTVFHLTPVVWDDLEPIPARSFHVSGSLAVLEAAGKAGPVRKLVITSLAAAYGARRGNRLPLKEEAPLRARGPGAGTRARNMEEEIAKTLHDLRPSAEVSILRICDISDGAGRVTGPMRPWMELPVGISLALKDSPVQFAAQEDLLQVLLRILEAPRFRGVYNVAPDGHTTLRRICRSTKPRRIRVPYPLLWLALFMGRILKLTAPELSESLAAQMAYPVIADNSKLKRDLGVEFQYDSETAVVRRAPACRITPAPG